MCIKKETNANAPAQRELSWKEPTRTLLCSYFSYLTVKKGYVHIYDLSGLSFW